MRQRNDPQHRFHMLSEMLKHAELVVGFVERRRLFGLSLCPAFLYARVCHVSRHDSCA